MKLEHKICADCSRSTYPDGVSAARVKAHLENSQKPETEKGPQSPLLTPGDFQLVEEE